MEEEKNSRGIKDLTIEDKAAIMTDRLANPELTQSAFAKKHNIKPVAISQLEKKVNFSQEHAVSALMANIMKKDDKLIKLSTKIKEKWAEGVSNKRTIKSKDIEVLDKIESTAMKRMALIKAAHDAKETNKPLDIQIIL